MTTKQDEKKTLEAAAEVARESTEARLAEILSELRGHITAFKGGDVEKKKLSPAERVTAAAKLAAAGVPTQIIASILGTGVTLGALAALSAWLNAPMVLSIGLLALLLGPVIFICYVRGQEAQAYVEYLVAKTRAI